MSEFRSKVGLIVPSNNTLIEKEIRSILLSEGIILHVIKIPSLGYGSESVVKKIKNAESAVHTLISNNIDLIFYCCLSSTLMKYKHWRNFFERSSELAKCPIITAFDATVIGLKKLNLSNILLVSPYPKDVHEILLKTFASVGIKVAMDINNPIENIEKISKVNPSSVYKSIVKSLISKAIEGICIVSTDLPTLSIIHALETDLGKPVVTTNQAILYIALKKIVTRFNHINYGSLLKEN